MNRVIKKIAALNIAKLFDELDMNPQDANTLLAEFIAINAVQMAEGDLTKAKEMFAGIQQTFNAEAEDIAPKFNEWRNKEVSRDKDPGRIGFI